MSFWKSLFGNSNNESEKEKNDYEIPRQFRDWVIKSINLIGRNGAKMENEELHELLIRNGISNIDAEEIIIFLPTAFCRKLLPDINWLPNYIDFYSDQKQVLRRYEDNERYLIIEEETDNYWKSNPSNEVVLNIAGRSSEFNAINQMLNDGGQLENVGLTESLVIRYL